MYVCFHTILLLFHVAQTPTEVYLIFALFFMNELYPDAMCSVHTYTVFATYTTSNILYFHSYRCANMYVYVCVYEYRSLMIYSNKISCVRQFTILRYRYKYVYAKYQVVNGIQENRFTCTCALLSKQKIVCVFVFFFFLLLIVSFQSHPESYILIFLNKISHILACFIPLHCFV